MPFRTVAEVIYAEAHEMGPLTVRQPLPSEQLPYFDPFVLLHHAPPKDYGGAPGVSWHPHRGFAPVSFIFKGGIRHRDSQGNDATVLAGGTQWMHAGSGLLHEETPFRVRPSDSALDQLARASQDGSADLPPALTGSDAGERQRRPSRHTARDCR